MPTKLYRLAQEMVRWFFEAKGPSPDSHHSQRFVVRPQVAPDLVFHPLAGHGDRRRRYDGRRLAVEA